MLPALLRLTVIPRARIEYEMIDRVEAVEFVGNVRYELYGSHFRTAIAMYRNL